MESIRFISILAKKFPRQLATVTFFTLIARVASSASLILFAPVIDFYIHPDGTNLGSMTLKVVEFLQFFHLGSDLKNLIWLLFVLITIGSCLELIAQYLMLKTKYIVLQDLVIGTFEVFFRARWAFFSSGQQGTYLNTFQREMLAAGDALMALSRFIANTTEAVLFCIIPFLISWQLMLIASGLTLLLTAPFFLFGKVSYRLGKVCTATSNKFTSAIHENLLAAKTVLGFAKQKTSLHNVSNSFDAHRRATMKSQTVTAAILTLYRPFAMMALIVTMYYGRYFNVPLPEMAVLLVGLLRGLQMVNNAMAQKNSLNNYFPSFEQITLLKEKAMNLRQRTGNKIFKKLQKAIVIEDLSFAYPDRQPALSRMSCRIPVGSMVAFVGKSGAGKTTLLDMVMGFHEPIEGRILVDNIDLSELDIQSFRQRIGYVPQDSILFNLSIRDNLLWAKSDATDEELWDACTQANASEFIKQLPNRFETVIGDRGARLSGGQVQRLALARAILIKPELLILDEATSSLDSYSERLIQQAIEKISKETTIIVIAHRLSTIMRADYIYVLDNGVTVEEGGYSELMDKKGYFNDMAQTQFLGMTP